MSFTRYFLQMLIVVLPVCSIAMQENKRRKIHGAQEEQSVYLDASLANRLSIKSTVFSNLQLMIDQKNPDLSGLLTKKHVTLLEKCGLFEPDQKSDEALHVASTIMHWDIKDLFSLYNAADKLDIPTARFACSTAIAHRLSQDNQTWNSLMDLKSIGTIDLDTLYFYNALQVNQRGFDVNLYAWLHDSASTQQIQLRNRGTPYAWSKQGLWIAYMLPCGETSSFRQLDIYDRLGKLIIHSVMLEPESHVAINEDGNIIAYSNSIGLMLINEPLGIMQSQPCQSVSAIAIDAAGSQVAAGTSTGEIIYFNFVSRERQGFRVNDAPMYRVDFTQDMKNIIGISQGHIHLLDLETNKHWKVDNPCIKGGTAIMSPDGSRIAYATNPSQQETEIGVWNLHDNTFDVVKRRYFNHQSLYFSDDSKDLFLADHAIAQLPIDSHELHKGPRMLQKNCALVYTKLGGFVQSEALISAKINGSKRDWNFVHTTSAQYYHVPNNPYTVTVGRNGPWLVRWIREINRSKINQLTLEQYCILRRIQALWYSGESTYVMKEWREQAAFYKLPREIMEALYGRGIEKIDF